MGPGTIDLRIKRYSPAKEVTPPYYLGQGLSRGSQIDHGAWLCASKPWRKLWSMASSCLNGSPVIKTADPFSTPVTLTMSFPRAPPSLLNDGQGDTPARTAPRGPLLDPESRDKRYLQIKYD